MLLSDIKTNIGRRVADPLLDTYSGVVQGYFEQAFLALIRKRSENSLLPVYEDEITPLLDFHRAILTPYNGLADFDISEIDNLLYVFNILSPITSIVNYKYITIKELNDISLNLNLLPSTNEGYWSKIGKRIRVLISVGTLGSTSLAMDIALVKNPDTSTWDNNTDFSDYGIGFIYDAIDLASSLLRQQIGIEG